MVKIGVLIEVEGSVRDSCVSGPNVGAEIDVEGMSRVSDESRIVASSVSRVEGTVRDEVPSTSEFGSVNDLDNPVGMSGLLVGRSNVISVSTLVGSDRIVDEIESDTPVAASRSDFDKILSRLMVEERSGSVMLRPVV